MILRPIRPYTRPQSLWRKLSLIAFPIAPVIMNVRAWPLRAFLIFLSVAALALTILDIWKTSPQGAARIANITQMRPSVFKSFLIILLTRPTGIQ